MEKTDETDETEAQTVSTIVGFVPLSKLGMILPHEHIPHYYLSTKYTTTKQKIHPFLNSKQKIHPYLNCDWCKMDENLSKTLKVICDQDKQILINRGHHKMHPYTPISDPMCPHYYHCMITEELKNAIKSDVNTIVENTSYGLMRNISKLVKLSKDSKINIIAGTGFYAANVQDKKILSLSIEKMYKIMKKDLTQNYLPYSKNENEDANIQQNIFAGFIGTVGISSPIHKFEKHSICATAEVQSELGCPVSFSPAMGTCDYREVLRIYQEAGGKSDKVVMTHIDCTLTKKTELMEFLDDTNCYIQFSMFGDEWSFNHRDDNLDMLSDAQRIKRLKLLKNNLELHRVLISHDIHTHNRMTCYGGHGYTHISYTKKYMSIRGLDENDFTQITCKNPKNWLFWNQQSKI